jgi:hypothetical protein
MNSRCVAISRRGEADAWDDVTTDEACGRPCGEMGEGAVTLTGQRNERQDDLGIRIVL